MQTTPRFRYRVELVEGSWAQALPRFATDRRRAESIFLKGQLQVGQLLELTSSLSRCLSLPLKERTSLERLARNDPYRTMVVGVVLRGHPLVAPKLRKNSEGWPRRTTPTTPGEKVHRRKEGAEGVAQ
jgi:hypothetical protein